jgi:DNA polymerase III gamma/tau subunit
LKLCPEASPLVAQILPEERERLKPVADAFSEEDLLRAIDVLTKADADLRLVQDPRVTLELALLKLVQLRRLMPFADLVARVERLAGGATPEPRRPEPSPRPAVAATAAPAPAVEPKAPLPAEPPAADGGGLLQAMLAACAARPSLAQPLRNARVRLEGSSLTLEVAPDFAAFTGMHVDEYRDLASRAAGRPLRVTVAAGAAVAADGADDAAPSQSELKRERLMKEASREPAIQEALDLFGGRVVDVRDAKS